MGLFDDSLDSQKSSSELSKPEAFMGILLAAIASDGHISDEECQGMYTITRRMKMFENYSDDKCQNIIDRLLGVMKRRGLESLLRRCAAALPEKLHPTVFAAACDLVMADGGVEDEEKEFLDDLQRMLEVSGDQALDIVEVMIIKNRG